MARKSTHPISAFARAAKRAGRKLALVGAFSMVAGCANTGVRAEPEVIKTTVTTTTVDAVPHTPAKSDAETPPPVLPYEQQLFRFNDLPSSTAPGATANDNIAGMTSQQRAGYYAQKFCFAADGAAAARAASPQSQKELAEALDALSRLTYMGRPMVSLGQEADLSFCGLSHLPNGIAAQYLPGIHAVVAGPFTTREERVLKLAHEILHAAQDRNGLLNYGYNWDASSRITRNLSIEAASLTSEFMIAYEAKLAGDASYWDHLRTHYAGTTYGNADTYRLIDTTYQAAITAGQAPDAALRAAGRAAFEHVFDGADWRNFYLNSELQSYMGDIAQGRFRNNRTVAHNQFGQDDIDKAGRVGSLASFTSGAHVPPAADLLARDEKMKWAWEAAEIARAEQSTDTRADAQRVAALLNGNPYLGLDIAEVYRRATDESWDKSARFRYLWQIMDDMAGSPAPQSAPAAAKMAGAPIKTPGAPVPKKGS